MARKRSRRTRRPRRGSARIPSRHRGMSKTDALKTFIMLAPAVGKALNDGENAGGLTTKAGIVKGVLPSLTTSYSGFNTNDGKFYAEDLVYGYAPIIGVMLASKLGVFKTIGRALK